MLTICWAVKGGSGTSVVASTLALTCNRPALLVDLAGDLPLILGIPEPDTPGIFDWIASDAPPQRMTSLEQPIDQRSALLHRGNLARASVERWRLATETWHDDARSIVVDAGTNPPSALLGAAGATSLLVTRACYVSLSHAARTVQTGMRPSGVVLVAEPGRSLRAADIEATVGAPVVSTIQIDPAVARAVDAGLLATRLPTSLRRTLPEAA